MSIVTPESYQDSQAPPVSSFLPSRSVLSDREIQIELMKCGASCGYFIDHYCYIDDTQGDGDGSGVIPFKLWSYQVGLLWKIEQEDLKLLIILKARQLGLSWLVCAYELWRCLFMKSQLILLLSIGEKEAIELLRRVKRMYERLPQWMRDRNPLARRPNTEEMELSNGSRVISLSSSESKGSGYTASSVVLDEFAKNPVANSLFSAIMPTVEAGKGQLIIISTAFGVGGKYHEIWNKSSRGESNFHTVFFPWWVRPGRDVAWYQAQVDKETDPDRVKENYPSNPTEAFRTSGVSRFRQSWVEAQSVNVRDCIPSVQIRGELGKLENVEIYKLPHKERSYIIGADTSEGVGGDLDDAVILDIDTWEEVAHLSGQWEPDYFAKQLMILSRAYNRAMVAVERNNHGHAVVVTFKLLEFADVTKDDDQRYGIKTNLKSKPEMIDGLAEALRDQLVIIHSQATLDEILVYRREPNGVTSAPPGFHDDRVMSLALALAAIRKPQENYNIGPAVEIKLEKRPLFAIPDPEMSWNRQDTGRSSLSFTPIGRIKERRNFYGR
jgi:hypothetical protein